MVLAELNELVGAAVGPFLPENSLAGWVVANAFIILTVVAVLIIILFLCAALFFDFITDVWKIPFGAAADVCKYFALMNPWFALASAIAGAFTFILLSDINWFLRVLFTIISVGLAAVTWWFGFFAWAALLAIAPINTIMIFVATIID